MCVLLISYPFLFVCVCVSCMCFSVYVSRGFVSVHGESSECVSRGCLTSVFVSSEFVECLVDVSQYIVA